MMIMITKVICKTKMRIKSIKIFFQNYFITDACFNVYRIVHNTKEKNVIERTSKIAALCLAFRKQISHQISQWQQRDECLTNYNFMECWWRWWTHKYKAELLFDNLKSMFNAISHHWLALRYVQPCMIEMIHRIFHKVAVEVDQNFLSLCRCRWKFLHLDRRVGLDSLPIHVECHRIAEDGQWIAL